MPSKSSQTLVRARNSNAPTKATCRKVPTTDLVTAATGDITFADYLSFISAHIPPLDTAAQPGLVHEIETDEDDTESSYDGDSTFGEGSSDTTSITSSIINYKYENGRRYHAYKEGKYVLPNDDKEQERLDLAHHIFLLIHEGKLFECPLKKNPKRILDVGCGTGIWAIAMADEFPGAEVIGTDLSPIQPTWVPPNCQFQVDDCEADWNFSPSQRFDMIRLAFMGGCIVDWPGLLSQVYEHLTPGGWVELYDAGHMSACDDGTMREDSCFKTYERALVEACKRFGRELGPGHKQAGWLKDIGFEEISDTLKKVPISPWSTEPKAKELGKWTAIHTEAVFESYGLALFDRVLGWSLPKIHALIAGCKKELWKGDMHIYTQVHTVYARKPLN